MLNTTPSSDSREGVAFLQHRIAQFALMSAALGAILWVFRAILGVGEAGGAGAAAGDYKELSEPSFALHGLGIAFVLLLWLLCRGKPRSRRFVERAEIVCLLSSVVCYEAMGATIRLEAHPELIVLLALTLVTLARAVYVPSSPRRTLILAIVAGVPLVASVFLAYRYGPELPGVPPASRGLVAALVTGVWWSTTVTLATATSRVIYGLRREAREARQLGQYTLEEKVGEGGMGVVYRARHAMLRRPTAVKLLLPEHSGEKQLARFEREVQLTARLTHPNTITIFDYGRTPDGIFYYAMELLNGATLEQIVEMDGPQPAERVAHILEQVAGALTEAHGIGLIHRDIKPANVILCDQGGMPDVAKVLDFGLVKRVGDEAQADTASSEHTIVGTPLYLAPEAILGPETVDARSDLYSLGAVAYYLLTGQEVFRGKSFIEVCGHHLHTAPIPPAERLAAPVSEPLSALILRCLAKDPQARPESALRLLEEMRALGIARAWDARRAADWWKGHAKALQALRRAPSSPAMTRTIAVDLAGRFDRLDQYLTKLAS